LFHREAVIAYDTPYLGLNPGTFQNTADQYIQTATQAHDLFSSLTGISLASLWGAKAVSDTAAKGKGKASPVASTSKRKEEELMQASTQAAADSAAGSWLNIKTAAAVGGTACVPNYVSKPLIRRLFARTVSQQV
jgi:hypothetical protein